MFVKFRDQKIELSDWRAFGDNEFNYFRVGSNEEYVGWMVSWKNYKSHEYEYIPRFFGANLHQLAEVYFRFYPSPNAFIHKGIYYPSQSEPQLKFKSNQIDEAKNHMDKFISRLNKIKVFI